MLVGRAGPPACDSLWGWGVHVSAKTVLQVLWGQELLEGAPVSAEATHWVWQGGSHMAGFKARYHVRFPVQVPRAGCLTWDPTSPLPGEDRCVSCLPS